MLLFITKIVIKQKLPKEILEEKLSKTNKTEVFYLFYEQAFSIDQYD